MASRRDEIIARQRANSKTVGELQQEMPVGKDMQARVNSILTTCSGRSLSVKAQGYKKPNAAKMT
jgi:hypothetical protein